MSVLQLDQVTVRQPKFSYETISEDFIERTVQQLRNQQSVVLLGPQGLGRHIVTEQIQRQLSADSQNKFVLVRCSKHLNKTERELCEHISEGFGERCQTLEDLPRRIRKSVATCPRNLIFLITNIDLLPNAWARSLLKSFRQLMHSGEEWAGSLTVMLTGSFDLAPLVYGVDSEFSADYQYVAQRLGVELFCREGVRLFEIVGLGVLQGELESLSEDCSGNLLLLRLVIEAYLDYHRRERPKGTPVEVLNKVLKELKDTPPYWAADLLIRFFARMESSTESLEAIEKLLQIDEISLSDFPSYDGPGKANTSPTELELCGLAKREGDLLKWHSPLIESLAKHYFTELVLGDAYACCNDWEHAFACYQRAVDNRLPWGNSSTGRPRLRAAQCSFESELHSVAGQASLSQLFDFFRKGACRLFGFDELTVWSHCETTGQWQVIPSSQWLPETSRPEEVPSAFLDRHRIALNSPVLGNGDLDLEAADAPFIFCKLLPPIDGCPRQALVMSCLGSRNPITRERRKQVESATEVFCNAFRQSHAHRRLSSEAEYQSHLLESLPDVFRVMGGASSRTKQALEVAGEALRRHGYRRVMFSMVDLARYRIVGVIDCREPGEPDVAEMTDWPLRREVGTNEAEFLRDVQQACVLHGTTMTIADATTHRLTNKEVVREADLRSMVIIPIKLPTQNKVLGTMHVERQDRLPLERDQVKALEYFAQQVARAIDVTIRTDLVENITHNQTDAIVLVDNLEKVRYVNDRGGRWIQAPVGWQDHEPPPAEKKLSNDVISVMRRSQAMAKNQCALEHGSDLSTQASDGAVSGYLKPEREGDGMRIVHARSVQDWRGCRVGTLIQVRDMTTQGVLLKAIRGFATCHTTAELAQAVVDTIQDLGHGWARLYLYDSGNNRLIGKAQTGFDINSREATVFRNDTMLLPSYGESPNSWRCLKEDKPVVFTISSNRLPGEQFSTANGLSCHNIQEQHRDHWLQKRSGEYWADFPMLIREGVDSWLGKVSVKLDETTPLERFEFLRILIEAAASAFAAIADHEANEKREAEKTQRAMQLAIGETCHQLNSKILSLGTLEALYEGASPETVKKLNEEWRRRKQEIQEVLEDATVRLKPIQCEMERLDLLDVIRGVCRNHLGDRFEIDVESTSNPWAKTSYLADFDFTRLVEALELMFMNSRKAVGKAKALFMRIGISTLEVGPGYAPQCKIRIQDNGPGIRPERREQVFDEFFSEWPEIEKRGSGLGLTFVQNVVRAHDGTIQCVEAVESELGGACFEILFPRYSRRSQASLGHEDYFAN